MEASRCLSTGEGVKRQHRCTMADGAARKGELMPSAATWMDLEGITLSQSKANAARCPYTWKLQELDTLKQTQWWL